MLAHYVGYTQPNQERRAHEEISILGYDVTWLRVREEYRTKHGRHIKTVSLFPCYIFILLDIINHDWEEITKCRGFDRFLGNDPSRPASLDHGVVWELRKRFDASEFKPAEIIAIPKKPIRVGDRVEVHAGSSEKVFGICKVSAKDRVKILMHYLGAERLIEMSADRVTSLEQPTQTGIDGPPA